MNKEGMISYLKEQEKPPSEEKTSLAGKLTQPLSI